MELETQLSDRAAEGSVIGSILLRNDLLYQLAAILEPSDFASTDHARAFAAMLEMGKEIDTLALHNQLLKTGTSPGVMALSGLMEGCVPAVVKTHAARVKEFSLRRRGVLVSQRAIEQLSDPSFPVEQSLAQVHESVLEVMAGTVEHPTMTGFQVANDAIRKIHERHARGERVSGRRFGLDCLDEFTGGLNAGEFAIVGARPSVGKTSLAVQAAVENSRYDHPVFIFSAEMTREQFFGRMLTQVSGISALKIRRAHLLSSAELSSLDTSAAEIACWPWYVADSSNPHISEVVSRAITEVKRHKCELIIVDHLHKIRGDGENDTSRMTNISAALTQLAKDYAPVLALSQLSNPEDKNKGKWPTQIDLRGSGMLAADAHIVVMLHREIDDQKQYTSSGYAIVEKQREGMTGALPTWFNVDLLKFTER